MVSSDVFKMRHYAKIYRKRGFSAFRVWDMVPEPYEQHYEEFWRAHESIGPRIEECSLKISPSESRIVVLEARLQDGGLESLKAIEERHGRLPNTPTAYAGQEVRHFYFKAPKGFMPRSVDGLFPGVNLIAKGGLVLAPPSIDPATGDEYRWDRDLDIAALEPAPLPPCLFKPLAGRKLTELKGELGSLEDGDCSLAVGSLLPVIPVNHTGEMISMCMDDFFRFVSLAMELEEVRHG